MSIINDNVRKLFEASGMTQRDFAEKYGITAKVMWTYLNGAMPNGPFLLRLCQDHSIDFHFFRSTRIKTDAKGNITNRPDRQKQVARIRKEIEKLMEERRSLEAAFDEKINKLLVELASVTNSWSHK